MRTRERTRRGFSSFARCQCHRRYPTAWGVRACFEIAWGPAARDFGCGQGGEDRASPQRAVRSEPTQAADKRPAAGGFSRKGPPAFVAPQSKIHEGYSLSSRLAIRLFPRKQDPTQFQNTLLGIRLFTPPLLHRSTSGRCHPRLITPYT